MRRPRRPARVLGGLVAIGLGVLIAAVGAGPAGSNPRPNPSGTTGWTVYHGDPVGSGVATGLGPVDTASPAWTSARLDGQLYGQPLVFDGSVLTATENDTVYALDEGRGRVEWSAHLGTPVPASLLPCGNIQPVVGITGTPVVDPARSEVFVVADELAHGQPRHVLVGLDVATGRVELSQVVDPPGADPAALLQRTGLALDGSQVVFGYGGNYGDCGPYHGWVVAVPEPGGAPTRFEVDAGPGQREGAVWMGGAAPIVDQSGNVWVSTGNGSVTSSSGPYDDSDAVLELSSSLQLLQYFAPTSWASDNASDLDLSSSPVLLGTGQVVGVGKSQVAYLLRGSRLGGIGGQTALVRTGCGDDVDGGSAVVGTTVYLPCLNGPLAVSVSASPPGLRVLWRASVGGGPPVVTGGLVWTIGQDGNLDGLDPATGRLRDQVQIGTPANHFPTPGVGDDVLVAPAADRLVAFTYGTTPPTTGGSTPTTVHQGAPVTTRAATTATTSKGGLSPGVLAALTAGLAVVLAAALGFALRHRRRPPSASS